MQVDGPHVPIAAQPGKRFPLPGSRRHSLLVAIGWVVGVRLLITISLAGAALLFPQPGLQEQYAGTGVPLMDSGLEGMLLGVWQREDALWYEKIATFGYSTQDMRAEFFPLLPALMWALHQVGGLPPVAAGIVISESSLLVAMYLLHRSVSSRFGVGVAYRTVAYMSLFPTAFFLHGPFSESLALALAVLAFSKVAEGKLAGAAVAAYLAGLARPQGVLLAPALAIAFLSGERTVLEWRLFSWSRERLARSLVLAVAPVLGLVTFLVAVDSAWRWPAVYSGTGLDHGIPSLHGIPSWPGAALVYAVQNFLSGVVYPIEVFNFVLAMALIPAVVAVVLRLNAGYAAYTVLLYLVPLSRFIPGFALMSFSRCALLLFPCFVVLALWGRGKRVHLAVIFLWLWWLIVWTLKFYTGYFVG